MILHVESPWLDWPWQETLIFLVTGAVGFLLTQFHFQPIIRYRQVRFKVKEGLVFYANALRYDDDHRERFMQGKESNRRTASQLMAIYEELPWWYRELISTKWFEQRPEEAGSELIGLSNSSDTKDGRARIKAIHEHLRIRTKLTYFSEEDES